MAPKTSIERWGKALKLAARQHGIATRQQLLGLGYPPEAIQFLLSADRLHPLWRGVYAVGRPEVGDLGRWMAATLACGPHSALSHLSAANLFGISDRQPDRIEITVPATVRRRRRGIQVHRSSTFLIAAVTTRRAGIPVTTPLRTLVDLATVLDRKPLERAINRADQSRLLTVPALRRGLEQLAARPGVLTLREIVDPATFARTRSDLERRLLDLALGVGLPMPETNVRVDGFEVDFYWRDLDLVVETDGLTYHRTPAAQARDRERDHAHLIAGRTCLRFTHHQVRHDRGRTRTKLLAAVERCRATRV